MLMTSRDWQPIGAARSGAMILDDAQGEYRLRDSDRNQMCWHQICASIGMNYTTFSHRVQVWGWHPAAALRHPVESHQHVVMSLNDLCRRVGTNRNTLNSRRARGLPFRQALLGEESAQ